MGLLESSSFCGVSPGKGSLFVAKKLGLNETLRNRGTAHFDQFAVGSLGAAMNQTRA